MYAHPFDGEGTIRRIGESNAPVGDGKLPNFAVVAADGREVARLLTSPFSTGAIPFMSAHVHITTPPTAFVSRADADRLQDGMRVRLKVGGRFLPGRRERNVIAELPGRKPEHLVVSAHFDSVWRGPGAIDNASGIEGVRRIGEALAGRDLEYTVQLVAFAAEEIKLTGSRYYVDEAKLRGELDGIARRRQPRLHRARREARRARVARRAARARASKLRARSACSTATSSRPGPATGGVDSHWFADAGVPAVTILHFPYDEYHLPTDLPALVDERQLDDAVALAIALVESQLARPIRR